MLALARGRRIPVELSRLEEHGVVVCTVSKVGWGVRRLGQRHRAGIALLLERDELRIAALHAMPPSARTADGDPLGITAGVRGWLPGSATAAEIAHAIRCVARGGMVLQTTASRRFFEQSAERAAAARQISEILRSRLSEREVEVLLALATGANNREIGEQLFISARTVKNHVSSILLRLGLENRTQAALLAIDSGMSTRVRTLDLIDSHTRRAAVRSTR